ncbi:MAG: aminoacetone oxidase family FAD-binding enzyme [Bacilli bacterium]|nr:aminoacetone oxidase family FAD-binding enzyme [Bacilli bacterium]
MSKIIVVGAGASGVIASLIASVNNEVILLDGEDKVLKKILLTGNGKCNYWNSDIKINKYNSNSLDSLNYIISDELVNNTYKYLESLGIYPCIKNGYYYPYSNQASSVREILVKALRKSNVTVITNCKVRNIYKSNNIFLVDTNSKKFSCDKVVLATGSKAYPKTGSDGSGYSLASSLGHTIVPVRSALAPLVLNETFLKEWDGVRSFGKVSLKVDNNILKEEIGEVQLTKYGISGICIFNLSSKASLKLQENKRVFLNINFFNETNNFYEFLEKRNRDNKTIEELLESIFNYKLMFVFLKKASVDKDSYWSELSEEEKQKLVQVIINFEVEVVGIVDDKGQVCAGGVSLDEVNDKTLESNIVNNLYFTGELLDVDGMCGGFNLAFAFMSGYLVGRSI